MCQYESHQINEGNRSNEHALGAANDDEAGRLGPRHKTQHAAKYQKISHVREQNASRLRKKNYIINSILIVKNIWLAVE